jgi:CRP/FNR family cyclic AMP-dependent transcriptional regulator
MRLAPGISLDQTKASSGAVEAPDRFSIDAQKELDSLKTVLDFPGNAVLFIEEQRPSTIMFLLQGQVKLSMNSSSGKRLILGIAVPGDTLALATSLSGSRYDITAETVQPCQIAFIDRDEFVRFLTRNPSAYKVIMRELCADNVRACGQVRRLGLAATAPAKLARLLLDWCADGQRTQQGTRLFCMLTHGEIGQCIGASRETVTRILSDFRYQDMVESRGSTLIISNRRALEECAGIESFD